MPKKGQHNSPATEFKKGSRLSEMTRRKISEAMTGNKNPFYGKRHTIETKKKISLFNRGNHYRFGKSQSEEAKKKMREAWAKQGYKPRRKWTDEERKKASETQKKITHLTSHFGSNNRRWKGGVSKNKEYIKEKKKQWIKNNPDKISYYNHLGKMRRRNAIGQHTLKEWQTLKIQYNWTCPACKRREPEIKLTIDHIIPLTKGGSDNIENIQPLCKSCNSKKYNTHSIKY